MVRVLREKYWYYYGLFWCKINNAHCRVHNKSWLKLYDFYSYKIEVGLSNWEDF